MALNRFEKEAREKLNEREINPSAAAWDRLDAMLTVTEERKPKRTINWMYIAAAFLAVLLAVTIFFSQQETIGESQNEVATEENAPIKTTEESIVPETNLLPNGTESEALAGTETPNEDRSQQKNINPPVIKRNSTQNAIAETVQQSANRQNNHQLIINQKSENPLPAVNVDELLAAVGNPQSTHAEKPVTVDAGSLLSQVDGELELTFREKVIKSVRKNYKEVKVALATRNQE